ncbi:MAG: rhomboid family intramembrane serine protease [Parachlamydiales bacterium]|nr:rhomboid family intramembrane serine protease [Parachlamydiales bacterium]
MRLLIAFDEDNLARKFSSFLQKNKIENTLEPNFDVKQKKTLFNLWVHSEDEFAKAKVFLQDFLKNPQDNKYSANEPVLNKQNEGDTLENKTFENGKEPKPIVDPLAKRKAFPFKITFFFLMLCASLYLLNFMQELKLAKKYDLKQVVLLTPLQNQFLFDIPEVRKQLDDIIIKYKIDNLKELENPPVAAKEEMDELEKIPTYKGLYDIVLLKLQSPKEKIVTGPMFEKIAQGQIWRFFTPCILHIGFLHILFNMLWLWFLGKQIEPRLGFIRYVVFIIITGVVSNIFQYLMGGPYFLGFSGVITAMVGYIFVRQKTAPWEGYTVAKPVFYFIGVFIFAMLALQLISFAVQIFKPKLIFTPGIANTAHIVGALCGMLLAKMPFFSWRGSVR